MIEKCCDNCKHIMMSLSIEPCVLCTGADRWESDGTEPVDLGARTEALSLVTKERNRQDIIWGEQNHAQQAWVGILGEEYGEYCQAVNETYLANATKKHEGGIENIMTELTHIAAVAVSAMESLMRNKEKQDV